MSHPAMAMFELNHRLPSSFVDKSLVLALERYLRPRLEHRVEVRGGVEWMWIEITHRAGRATLHSVSDLTSATFQEDTHEIAIVAQVHKPQPLEVLVRFSASRRDSFVRVRYTDDEARGLVLELLGGIERIVMERRTWNSWFCPEIGVAGLLDGLAVGVAMFAVYAFTAGSRVPRWIILTSLFLPFYRLVGLFKPYSAFQTPQTDTLRTVGNWLTAGLAGFAVLMTLGAYFDIDWLGF